MRKTNTAWHPVEELGSYYRLIDGELHVAAMLADGDIEVDAEGVNETFVEWDSLEPEVAEQLQVISAELAVAR